MSFFSSKFGIHSFSLGDGDLCIMYSDPKVVPTNQSFQTLVQHCVPKTKKASGYRINITFRIKQDAPYAFVPQQLVGKLTKEIDQGCYVLWSIKWLDSKTRTALKEEIYRLMQDHGEADTTIVWGKKHDNNGRKVMEMSFTKGQSYTYGGKTTSANCKFGPCATRIVKDMLCPLFLVDPADVWAHVVFYPDPSCSLGWHGDQEDGIMPHVVASLTLLEFPVKGKRPFQVRSKSVLGKKKRKAME